MFLYLYITIRISISLYLVTRGSSFFLFGGTGRPDGPTSSCPLTTHVRVVKSGPEAEDLQRKPCAPRPGHEPGGSALRQAPCAACAARRCPSHTTGRRPENVAQGRCHLDTAHSSTQRRVGLRSLNPLRRTDHKAGHSFPCAAPCRPKQA